METIKVMMAVIMVMIMMMMMAEIVMIMAMMVGIIKQADGFIIPKIYIQ